MLVGVALVYAPRPLLTLVLLVLAAVGVVEMYGLLSSKQQELPLPLGVALVTLLVLSAANLHVRLLGVSVFLCLAAPLLWSLSRERHARGPEVWAYSAAGALYVGWPLAHIELLRLLPGGRDWLILAIACTWATDTGAYIVGSVLGKHQLAPRVSPAKTVEGAIGGLALTVVVGLLVEAIVGLRVALWGGALVALALSVVAQLGDLAESHVKRLAGAKDSGNLIPGHGGLLDRIDGLLWAVVATYYIAAAIIL